MSVHVVLHLVSHASGELVELVARNAVAQLDHVEIERNTWKYVRSIAQVPDILAAIASRRGFVFHSVAATDVREALETGCRQLRQPCVFVLEPFISQLAEHTGVPVRHRSSDHDVIDEDFYRRVEAMKYAIGHDDGLASDYLDDADVIVVGVSRSTKTPTCMYLASRGLKAANVPLVPGVPLPQGVVDAKQPLIVALTVDPRRLSLLRTARLKALKEDASQDYADIEAIAEEVREARRLFARRRWPVIDTTERAVEATAALIIKLLRERAHPAAS